MARASKKGGAAPAATQVNSLPSSGERQLREIKRRLVLELYLREGAFWVETKDAERTLEH